MKIALVSPYDYLYPGGVTRHISYLDRHFRDWGYDVRIIAPCSADAGALPDHLIVASSTVLPVPYSGSIARISLSPRIYWRVKRILRQERFEIVHAHEPLAPALPLAVLRHSKAVNVGTFHAHRETHAVYAYGKPVAKRFINRLDGRIAVSAAARDSVASYFPGEYEIIPNGIDLERFSPQHVRPAERFAEDGLNILFVGRLEKRKGFRHLLAAFARVKEQVPEARLMVVGAYDKDDKAPYLLYVRSHRIRGVHFVGYVSEDELPSYYAACHVFCAPSTGYESFGLVLLEAMASGRPLVASDISGYRELLASGREALLVPPGDEVALSEALVRLLRDPALRARMGESGLAKSQGYAWKSVARQVLDYYQELLARDQTPQAESAEVQAQ